MSIHNNLNLGALPAFGTRFDKGLQGKTTGAADVAAITGGAARPMIAPTIPPATGAGIAGVVGGRERVSSEDGGAEPARAVPARAAFEVATRIDPGRLAAPTIDPSLLGPLIIPPLFQPVRTATQIARNSIQVLANASGDTLASAISKTEDIGPARLMNRLERRVLIGEVLNDMAAEWSAETVQDFADAFRLPPERRDVMDAIVALAVLNDSDLEQELMAENLAHSSEGDLLANRRIVQQWPAAGERVQGPVVIMVAVEYRDIAEAEAELEAITGQLVEHSGHKMPREAASKLRQRGN